jgi:hypothetical protein
MHNNTISAVSLTPHLPPSSPFSFPSPSQSTAFTSTSSALNISSTQKNKRDSSSDSKDYATQQTHEAKAPLGASGGVLTGWKCGICGTVQEAGSGEFVMWFWTEGVCGLEHCELVI